MNQYVLLFKVTLVTASLIRQLTFFSPAVALGVSGGYRWEALRSIFLPESPLEIFFLIGYGISPNHRGLGGCWDARFLVKVACNRSSKARVLHRGGLRAPHSVVG